MKAIVGVGFATFASLFLAIGFAAAQPANLGCSSDNPAGASQTLRCEGGVIIVAETIAAVRGTKWAVDAVAGKTSVFVVNGKVRVARQATDRVVLGPGEGVDVEASGVLTVKRWPPARVAALMARLAQ